MSNISKFEELQKRGNLSTNNLDRILQNLEKKGFMTPVEKSGPFGKSVQLKITEKGAREFRRMWFGSLKSWMIWEFVFLKSVVDPKGFGKILSIKKDPFSKN